jgi:hypothetical protein
MICQRVEGAKEFGREHHPLSKSFQLGNWAQTFQKPNHLKCISNHKEEFSKAKNEWSTQRPEPGERICSVWLQSGGKVVQQSKEQLCGTKLWESLGVRLCSLGSRELRRLSRDEHGRTVLESSLGLERESSWKAVLTGKRRENLHLTPISETG